MKKFLKFKFVSALLVISTFSILSFPLISGIRADELISTRTQELEKSESNVDGDKGLNSFQYTFLSILNSENNLKNHHNKLTEEGYSSEDFYSQIILPLNHGEKLNTDYLTQWQDKNFLFHKERYLLNFRKQHFFMTATHSALLDFVENLVSEKSSLAPYKKKNLKNRFYELDSIFMSWAENCDSLLEGGFPKEQKERIYAIDEYFPKVRRLLKEAGRSPRMKVSSHYLEWQQFKGFVKAGSSLTYVLLQTAGRNLGSLLNLINPFPYITPDSLKNKFNDKFYTNSTPFTRQLNSLFTNFSRMRGYTVIIGGWDNLKDIPINGIPGKKIVNLFLPAHRDGVADAMIMGHLNLPHYLMFANPSSFAPHSTIANSLASLPEFISVGKYRGYPPLTPTEKVLRSLNDKRSPNVINYPQGFVANAGEILPINSSFVSKLLHPLIVAGYDVNIIPISYEVDSTFLSQSGGVDNKTLKAFFHPPLFSHTVSKLVHYQIDLTQKAGVNNSRYKIIDHFFSSLWYENIKEHGELTLNQMIDREAENVGIDFYPEFNTIPDSQ